MTERTFTENEILDALQGLRDEISENRILIVQRRESARTWEIATAATAVIIAILFVAVAFIAVYLIPITNSLNESDKKQNASDIRVELILHRQECLSETNAKVWQALVPVLDKPNPSPERTTAAEALGEVAKEYDECK
jgi:hypothetical protein